MSREQQLGSYRKRTVFRACLDFSTAGIFVSFRVILAPTEGGVGLLRRLRRVAKAPKGDEKTKSRKFQTSSYYTQIKEWIRQYRANGAEGLSMKNTRYPVSLKAEVVSKILDKELSLHQASIDYRIERSVLRKWIKKVKAEGAASLSIDNRGRHRKSCTDKKPKKPPVQLSREQELLNENERLRAEVAYLKKLRTLVEERVARESGIGRKPSKD